MNSTSQRQGFVCGCAILGVLAAGALGLTRVPASVSPDDGVIIPNDEGCTFCVEVTDSQGVTKKACDTIGACASNQDCSGDGGVDDKGNPWAKARCVPQHIPAQP